MTHPFKDSPKVLEPRLENIPKELKVLRQWVCWKAVFEEDGKINKPPIDVKTGGFASSTDPATWASYTQVVNYYRKQKGNGISGIGFVFSQNDEYAGFDIDFCIDPKTEEPRDWAMADIAAFDTYTEISPSGKGVKGILKGRVPNGEGRKQGHYEAYSEGRYFTLTGHHLGITPPSIQPRQRQLDTFYKKHFARAQKPPQAKPPPGESAQWNGDVDSLPVSYAMKKLIREGEEKGRRSEATFSAIIALVKARIADADIISIFEKHEIGEKYREKGRVKAKWLQGELKRAKAVVSVRAQDREKEKKRPTQSEILLKIATKFELMHTPDGEVFAAIRRRGHQELWDVSATEFKNILSNAFYNLEGKAPNSQAMTDALSVIRGMGLFGAPEAPVYLRLARVDDAIYLDLVNDKWEAIEITGNGWKLVNDPPVNFKRVRGMLPLPYPLPNGSLGDLAMFLNLPPPPKKDQKVSPSIQDRDEIFRLIVAWLVQAANPTGPYPVLVINGEQGSAKSTVEKFLRQIIDPNAAPLRSPPRSEHDLVIACKNGWIVGYDNLSGISNWLSDALCRISTGAGFATRQLYTDSEEVLFYSCRPIILNGIDNLLFRQDLASRAILVTLPPIPDDKYIEESGLKETFQSALPSILGGLCTAISTALKNQKTVTVKKRPRMADFVRWIQAAEPALPWSENGFMDVYDENRRNIVELSIGEDSVGDALRSWLNNQPMLKDWEGDASTLLENLETIVDKKTREGKGWPKAPHSLSRRLNRLTNFMRMSGIEIEFDRKGKDGKRIIKIRKLNDGIAPKKADAFAPKADAFEGQADAFETQIASPSSG